VDHATRRPDVTVELERFTRACHEQGKPVTHQRLAVYRALLESHVHPDADSIFQVKRLAGVPIFHELDSSNEADLANIADIWVLPKSLKLDRHYFD